MSIQGKSFRDDILEIAIGPIEAISVDSWNEWRQDDPRHIPLIPFMGKCVPWDTVKDLLNYSYDPSYGSLDCHMITAWTATQVIYIHEYDGATWPESVPRNPDPIKLTLSTPS